MPPDDADRPSDTLSKRDLLRRGGERLRQSGALVIDYAADRFVDRFTPRVQRPPGAIPEFEFLIACTRCGACVDACPVGAIRTLSDEAGLSSGTPFLDVNNLRPCVVCDDAPCMPACPVGALEVMDMGDAVMGTAVLDRANCLAWGGGTCERCIDACPYPDDAILADEEGRVYIDARQCIGCGLCRAACPTHPKSITILPPPRY